MRTKADLDAVFEELVRAADTAFPGTREPTINSPAPSFPRRWLLLTAAVAVAVVAVSIALSLGPSDTSAPHSPPPAGSTGLPPTGFTGNWVSTDVVDGSAQTLDVAGSGTGGRFTTRLHDTVATIACGGGPADVQGPGRLAGGELLVTFTVACPGGGKPSSTLGQVGHATYVYHSDSDTLTDDSGNVWRRAPGQDGAQRRN